MKTGEDTEAVSKKAILVIRNNKTEYVTLVA